MPVNAHVVATTDGHERFFPYEEPYPNQRSAMAEIADALDDQRDVLLEGAPGTGKTLSALVPALTQLVAILLLAFVWGYAYHVRTFGREDDDWRRR